MPLTRRAFLATAAAAAAPARPLHATIDLNAGPAERIQLADGSAATVRILSVKARRDSVRSAVRSVAVAAEINGERVTLGSGNYHLPVAAGGVQVDCPITSDFLSNSNSDAWALEKQVRLRLWPAKSPWLTPGAMLYPVNQRWFATNTQMSNEPSFVNGEEEFARTKIYYHSGLDIGGVEGMVQVVAATDGVLAQLGTAVAKGHEDSAVRPRYDVIYLADSRGWYYRYSHLHSFAEGLELGRPVRQGQPLGLLGKEGASGGWSHLHFEVVARQPSGRWGTEEGYAFLWEAYRRQHNPGLVAVARPHHVALVGETVRLDGGFSWSRAGKIARYRWTLTGGGAAEGPVIETRFAAPGSYCEILEVTGADGAVAWDFAPVQVLDAAAKDKLPPLVHVAYFPSFGLRAGQQVTFKVRTFRTDPGEVKLDFGDRSAPAILHGDGCLKALAKDGYAVATHAYAKPGNYFPVATHSGGHGLQATARLWLEVAP
jgi:murein DD-endopeptidase MepM/ murein hydrolase activator NlpD